MMGMLGQIEMDTTLAYERFFQKRPRPLLVAVIPMVSTVVDRMMTKKDFPPVTPFVDLDAILIHVVTKHQRKVAANALADTEQSGR